MHAWVIVPSLIKVRAVVKHQSEFWNNNSLTLIILYYIMQHFVGKGIWVFMTNVIVKNHHLICEPWCKVLYIWMLLRCRVCVRRAMKIHL